MNTKLKVIFISFLLFINDLEAQNVLPRLYTSGTTVESFVPEGWKIISKSEGDLNKDNQNDFAFVIEKRDEVMKEGDSVSTELTSRILGIFVKQKDGGYLKKAQSDTFIIIREESMKEPFQGVQISDDGSLDINFQIWDEKSIWFVSSHSYKFLLQNNIFDLVQYNLNETNRKTGNSTDYSIDFLLRKMTIYNYNFMNDKSPTTENRKFKLESLKNLESLKIPFEWDFQGLMI